MVRAFILARLPADFPANSFLFSSAPAPTRATRIPAGSAGGGRDGGRASAFSWLFRPSSGARGVPDTHNPRGSLRSPNEGNEVRRDERQGVGAFHSTDEAGEPYRRDPAEGRGCRFKQPLEGNTAGASEPVDVSAKQRRIDTERTFETRSRVRQLREHERRNPGTHKLVGRSNRPAQPLPELQGLTGEHGCLKTLSLAYFTFDCVRSFSRIATNRGSPRRASISGSVSSW